MKMKNQFSKSIIFTLAVMLFASSCKNNNEATTPGKLNSGTKDTVGNTDATGGNVIDTLKSGNKLEQEEAEDDETTEDKGNSNKTGDVGKIQSSDRDLVEAFKGEFIASSKYTEFAKKANQEGLKQIAALFYATALAEKIHSDNHKSVMKEKGIGIPNVDLNFQVMNTSENLKEAIKGEAFEVNTMYPKYLANAGANVNNQLMLISFNYALKTEIKHLGYFEKALIALNNNKVSNLTSVYKVCPTCGNTYNSKLPIKCGISMTSSERFIKINS